jgi:hypothetical protein
LVAPPTAFGALGVFRHPLVRPAFAERSDRFRELGSSSETHPETAASCDRLPGALAGPAESRESAPPMAFSSVQRSRNPESACAARTAGEVPPPPLPSPPGVSHALRGFVLQSPCGLVSCR